MPKKIKVLTSKDAAKKEASYSELFVYPSLVFNKLNKPIF